ncbi:MAG: glycosyltransferase family 2 protein, partial [Dehalococcoidia bacterium]
GSSDGTAEVAAQFPCRIISHEVNRGKGAAVRSGIEASRGEDVIIIDADGTYPVEEIPRIVRGLMEVDVVVASRLRGKDNIPGFNRLGNRLFHGLIRYLYGSQTSDPLTGLYGVKKEHLERMRLGSDDFGIESEIAIKAARMRLTTADFPIEYAERIGEPKLNGLKDGYRILKTIFKMLTLYNPTAAFILPGGSAFSMGIVLLAALMRGPLSIGGVTLDVNSLIVATMLCLAGFQVGVLGFTLNVYCLAQGYTTPDIITALFLRSNTAKNISTIGLLILAATFALGAWLSYGWAGGGFGAFDETKLLILTSFMGIFGLQLVFSSVFLSIFTTELGKTGKVRKAF